MKKSIIIFLLTQGGSLAFPLIIIPIIGKNLEVIQFGKIMTINIIATYIAIIVEYGFNFTGTRKIAEIKQNKKSVNRKFWSVFYAKSLISTIGFCIALIAAALLKTGPEYWPSIIASSLIIIAAWLSPLWLLYGFNKVNVISFTTLLPKAVAIIFALSVDINITSASLLLSAPVATTSILMLAYCFTTKISKPNFHKWPIKIKIELNRNRSMFIANSVTFIYSGFNTAIISAISGPYHAGIYNSAEKIIKSGVSIISTVVQANYPLACSAKTKIEKEKIFETTIKISLAVGLLGLFFTLAFSDFIIKILFGTKFTEATIILKTMAVLFAIMPLAISYSQLKFVAEKNENKLKKIYIHTSILYITIILPLIHYLSAWGGSLALIISEIFATIYMVQVVRKDEKCKQPASL